LRFFYSKEDLEQKIERTIPKICNQLEKLFFEKMPLLARFGFV